MCDCVGVCTRVFENAEESTNGKPGKGIAFSQGVRADNKAKHCAGPDFKLIVMMDR